MEETKKMAEKKTNNEQQLFVQKEPFEYNGKTYNRYFIKGMVRGRSLLHQRHGARQRGKNRPRPS